MTTTRLISSAMLRGMPLVFALCAAACIPSFAHKPAMTHQEVPYTSVEGQQWPTKRVALPEIQQLYGMHTSPEVAYVELNPDGAQTLLFVHGLGSYLKFWRYQLDHFAAQGYRVVALDMVGYGKSDKPSSFPYTMTAMADVVRVFMQETDIAKPIVIGHSMGGQTALSLAIRYPSLARGLVLAAPAGFEKFSRKERGWFDKVFSVAFIKSASEEEIWGSIRARNFYRWEDDYIWLIEERVRLAKSESFDAYALANVKSVSGLADNAFVRNNADKITVPTAIIHGDKDRLIPNPFLHGGFTRPIMEYGADQIPDSRLVTLEDCGHTVQMDCHDAFNAEMTAFLNERFPEPPEIPEVAAPEVDPEPETPVPPADAPEDPEEAPGDDAASLPGTPEVMPTPEEGAAQDAAPAEEQAEDAPEEVPSTHNEAQEAPTPTPPVEEPASDDAP